MSDTGGVPESPGVSLLGDSAQGFTPSWHFSNSAWWRRVLDIPVVLQRRVPSANCAADRRDPTGACAVGVDMHVVA